MADFGSRITEEELLAAYARDGAARWEQHAWTPPIEEEGAMRTLKVIHNPTDPMGEIVHITARLRLTDGAEVWLCNPYDGLKLAISQGQPFEAHQVKGMKPHAVLVNPAAVALVEEVEYERPNIVARGIGQ